MHFHDHNACAQGLTNLTNPERSEVVIEHFLYALQIRTRIIYDINNYLSM